MQQVIIYRNQTEAQIDQFLYQDGGAAFGFIVLMCLVAFVMGAVLVENLYKGNLRTKERIQICVGVVFAIITGWFLWL